MTPLKVFHQEQKNAADRFHYTNSWENDAARKSVQRKFTLILPLVDNNHYRIF
ncbi:hypothetical protein ACE1B6_00645 [Aerosakkonemataceae cyanobacterium BLCC-F154]|uniref:Uncharacterized protein n=1 Tax=Floridaenema fluviatile BLCC-F154 TaxID=3153640 RepID=A0ABV4Y660_9CYAN